MDAVPHNPDNENTRLTFSFLQNPALDNGADKFEIDPDTGEIRVKDDLDFEGDVQLLQVRLNLYIIDWCKKVCCDVRKYISYISG